MSRHQRSRKRNGWRKLGPEARVAVLPQGPLTISGIWPEITEETINS